MFRNRFVSLLVLTTTCALSSCGGGGSGSSGSGSGGSSGANYGCDGGCAHQALSTDDVRQILRQAVTATSQLGKAGTFAVVDRVGNVLALYQMTGAPGTTTITAQIGAAGGLEGAVVPSTLAAISKAGTGAYLSSQGNAFSTRTASQIIQEHYLPGQSNQPGGPLFGVQFSQFSCSDVTLETSNSAGPRPLPLGLAGDPGGLPLYKNGDLVGAIGVEFDGLYTVDRGVANTDTDDEERVALSASVGFAAPAERVGDNISLDGRSLRFAYLSYGDVTLPETLDEINDANLQSVSRYCRAEIRGGVPFGSVASGFADSSRAGVPSMILTNGGGQRFPTRAGRPLPGGVQLSGADVDALLDSALLTANRARAAIRTPRDTAARVTIFVVDDQGTPLGATRSQDAPVFGADVALQKARTAALFSSSDAGGVIGSAPGLARNYAGEYAAFTGIPLNGSYVFNSRSVGNMARPFLPDGIDGTAPGPFSLPFPGVGVGNTWSPFNTGLQFDLIAAAVLSGVTNPGGVPSSCASIGGRLRNGMQIFAGAVPLFRGETLIGAIGVSGDGINQDDLVAFYGASRRGLDYAGHTGSGDVTLGFNAPQERRADHIDLPTPQLRLRYSNCPEGPFIRDNDQNGCEGL